MHAIRGEVCALDQTIFINTQVGLETIGALTLSVRTCFDVPVSIRILSRATTLGLVGPTLLASTRLLCLRFFQAMSFPVIYDKLVSFILPDESYWKSVVLMF